MNAQQLSPKLINFNMSDDDSQTMHSIPDRAAHDDTMQPISADGAKAVRRRGIRFDPVIETDDVNSDTGATVDPHEEEERRKKYEDDKARAAAGLVGKEGPLTAEDSTLMADVARTVREEMESARDQAQDQFQALSAARRDNIRELMNTLRGEFEATQEKLKDGATDPAALFKLLPPATMSELWLRVERENMLAKRRMANAACAAEMMMLRNSTLSRCYGTLDKMWITYQTRMNSMCEMANNALKGTSLSREGHAAVIRIYEEIVMLQHEFITAIEDYFVVVHHVKYLAQNINTSCAAAQKPWTNKSGSMFDESESDHYEEEEQEDDNDSSSSDGGDDSAQ